MVNSCEIGGVVVSPADKDVMEPLLIEGRLRNATDVVADSNEGTVIGKEHRSKVAQICGRTGCLLFAGGLPHIGRLAMSGIFN